MCLIQHCQQAKNASRRELIKVISWVSRSWPQVLQWNKLEEWECRDETVKTENGVLLYYLCLAATPEVCQVLKMYVVCQDI